MSFSTRRSPAGLPSPRSMSSSVGTLRVKNPLDELVLLYEGEELVGAKQNRFLTRTTLVGARSAHEIPVVRPRRKTTAKSLSDLRRVASAISGPPSHSIADASMRSRLAAMTSGSHRPPWTSK
jgi:hypothetical protein